MVKLYVGRSKGDITPPSGVTMDGYSDRMKPSQGIHDKLSVRVLFLDDAEKSLALISCDVCWFSDQIVDQIKQHTNKMGITDTLVFSTHNHSGPSMTDVLVSPNDAALRYVEALPSMIAETVFQAKRTPVQAFAALSKSKARLNYNRRKPRSGPVDTEMIVMLLRDLGGKAVAAIANYACHPTILGPQNLLISGDWPSNFASRFDSSFGTEFVTVFLNGPCGDVIPFRNGGSFSDVDFMARRLFESGIQSLSRSREIELGRGICSNSLTIGPLPPSGLTMGLSAVSIGNLVILCVPGEIFAATGLSLKESVATNEMIVASHFGGYRGYLPTEDAFLRRDLETGPLCWVDSSAERQIILKGAILSNALLSEHKTRIE